MKNNTFVSDFIKSLWNVTNHSIEYFNQLVICWITILKTRVMFIQKYIFMKKLCKYLTIIIQKNLKTTDVTEIGLWQLASNQYICFKNRCNHFVALKNVCKGTLEGLILIIWVIIHLWNIFMIGGEADLGSACWIWVVNVIWLNAPLSHHALNS